MSDPITELISTFKYRCVPSDKSPWNVKHEKGLHSNWTYFYHKDCVFQEQGFKVHISASQQNALTIIEIVFPILINEKIHFKVANSQAALNDILNGRYGKTQVGKFITIYPSDNFQMVNICKTIDTATANLFSPRIPFENSLNEDSIVYYRYGSFSKRIVQLDSGQIVNAISNTNGDLIEDKRTINQHKLLGIVDPFIAEGLNVNNVIHESIILDTFFVVKQLSDNPKGRTSLVIDVKSPNNDFFIIKEAQKGLMIDENLVDANERLEREYEILKRLKHISFCPEVVDFIKGKQKSFLIYKYKEGVSLNQILLDFAGQCINVDNQSLYKWIDELCLHVQKLHNLRLIIADIKPDNIIIDKNGNLHLIDLELAHFEDDPYSRGFGTIGYSSIEKLHGLIPSSYKEDIFSLGCVFFSMITFMNLSFFNQNINHEEILSDHFINIPSRVRTLIIKCLKKQFQNIEDVRLFLQTDNEYSNSSPSTPKQKFDFLQFAINIGDSICNLSVRHKDQCYWTISHPISFGETGRDIYLGTSGIGIYLNELYQESGIDYFRTSSEFAANGLERSSMAIGRKEPLPGLYFGEAGVGLFFLKLWTTNKNSQYLTKSKTKSDLTALITPKTFDIMTGAAGIGLFNLMLFHSTNEIVFRNRAIYYAEFLLHNLDESSGYFWPELQITAGDRSKRYIGFSHGTAGIAYFMTEVYVASKDQQYLDFAEKVADWLIKIAVTNEDSINWESEFQSNHYALHWCHGTPGIGKLFMRLYDLNPTKSRTNLLVKIGNTIYNHGKWVGTTQCHGLAGNIEILIDLFQVTRSEEWLQKAIELGNLLVKLGCYQKNELRWQSERSDTFTPDFMVGESGIGNCFLRLNNPQKMEAISCKYFMSNLIKKEGNYAKL